MADKPFRVTCEKCKRSYSWKPERAGKKAKCQCGQIITMPMGPPKRPEPEEPTDDLYGLAELAADAQRAVVTPSPIAVIAAAPAEMPTPLDYRNSKVARDANQRTRSNLTDPVRDLYVPVGLIIAGTVGSLIWACLETKLGFAGLAIVSLLTAVLTLVKIVALVGAALMVAPIIGISFGLLGPAVLKFTGIIIFIDAAELWVNVILRATGGISASGATTIYILFVWFGLAVILMAGFFSYLFSLDANEVAMLAIPMTILSWIIGLLVSVVLFFVMAAMAVAVVGIHPPTMPMPIAAPTVSSLPVGGARVATAPPPATAAPAGPVNFDSEIAHRIHPPNGRSEVIGANKWIQMSGRGGANSPTNLLISKMYGAGAVNVYIDLLGGMRRPAIPGATGSLMYVELPTTEAQIAACVSVAKTYRTETGQNSTSPADAVTTQFLVIDLKR